VDTCVWSLALRRRNKALLQAEEQRLFGLLSEAIRDGRVMMIGPIRQELLCGIRDKAHFARTQRLLEAFADEELATDDYVEAARCFNSCRKHGVESGGIDMLICAVAAQRRCGILTSDRGLLRCIEVLRAEKVLL
jgi:hypothetical protein